jgi:Fe-S-cluster-containing dehydrogenase component
MNHDEPGSPSSRNEDAERVAPAKRPGNLLVTIPVRDEVKAPMSEMGRRSALKLMAASALLAAGAPGCNRKPYRKIVSMVDLAEYQRPGVPLYYASTWTQGQVPYGIMVKTVDGRPIKVEGLPDHPLNRGTTNSQMQAAALSLYDPARLQHPVQDGKQAEWDKLDQQIIEALSSAQSALLVTPASLGPSERAMVGRFLEACPAARHLVWESCHDQTRRDAWKAVYGTDAEVRPRLSKARIVLSLDADFLGTDGATLETTREFSETRRLASGDIKSAQLSRLYVAESAMTTTGSNADHRLVLRPSGMAALAAALRDAVGGDSSKLSEFAAEHHLDEKLLKALADDLKTHSKQSVVVAGSHLPPAVHAQVCLLNDVLEAAGNTLEWNATPANLPVNDLASLRAAMDAEGGIDVLIFLGGNPGHDWQPEFFDELLSKSKLVVGHGLYPNETLAKCTIALPSTHNLESWNDRAPFSGFTSLCQPLIAPIYEARQEAESLLRWTQGLAPGDADLQASEDWHQYLQTRWKQEVLAKDEDATQAWEEALRTGFVGEVAADPFPELNRAAAEELASQAVPTDSEYELVILPHHSVFDGRFAANAWLEELPDPVSKLVWGNAASLSPATARKLGVAESDRVTLGWQDAAGQAQNLELPVLVQPGVAEGVVVTTLGHGRTHAGDVGTDVGVNVARLLAAAGDAGATRCLADIKLTPAVSKRGDRLVRTQNTFSMMDRPIVRHGTREEYDADPHFAAHRSHVPPLKQLDEPVDYSQGHKWAMAVDLNVCTGCSACVVACQAENNIPVVGQEECGRGRIMQWIRLDRYEEGPEDNPHVYQQPMLCQHCDNAPCESVCPVNATAHSPEGLNEQAYNRCVGTRYCANNCPYKVRNFNYFNYQDRSLTEDVQELVYNPQVTVRSRGVMEKCTFCVQRINEVKFDKQNKDQPIPDGAIQPACAQACPAQAIVFGDVNDPDSKISQRRDSSLVYHVLEELNVRPNVSYLARVTNPHPELSEKKTEGGHS